MITAIAAAFALLMFVFATYAAIEYRREYNARMDAFMLEDEFVTDYLECQDAIKIATYKDGQKIIAAFSDRWKGIIRKDRVEYFTKVMTESLEYRIIYNQFSIN
jgi:hypothetical protein